MPINLPPIQICALPSSMCCVSWELDPFCSPTSYYINHPGSFDLRISQATENSIWRSADRRRKDSILLSLLPADAPTYEDALALAPVFPFPRRPRNSNGCPLLLFFPCLTVHSFFSPAHTSVRNHLVITCPFEPSGMNSVPFEVPDYREWGLMSEERWVVYRHYELGIYLFFLRKA